MEEQIINFIRKNPFIYDKTLKSYKNVDAKEKKWEEFADSIGEPVRKLKTRWKTLRDRFHRETKRASASGENSLTLYWKYYDQLSFLNTSNYATTSFKSSPPQCSRFSASLENEDVEFNDTAEYYSAFQPVNDDNLDDNVEEVSEADDVKTSPGTRGKPHLSSQNNSQCTRISSSFEKKPSKDVYIVLPSQNNDAQLEKAASTPASLFFHSIAMQVEKENLPFEKFSALQMKVLKLVREELLSNK